MNRYFYFLLLLICTGAFFTAVAQPKVPDILWQKTIGGNDADVLTATAIGANKTILLCGYSSSNTSGDKSDASYGNFDYWVVKMDSTGNVIWNKTFGGSKNDFGAAIICTSDGGYLVGGSSISDMSGNKSNNSYGSSTDYWVIKLDENGNILWDKTMGGLYNDKLTSLAELPNAGGYVVGGYSYSQNNGSKTLLNLGTESNADYWVITLNNDGTERWQSMFGGGSHEVLSCVAPAGATGLNSYYAAGWSYSSKRTGGYKSKNVFGNNDFYIVRYNTVTKQTEYQNDFGGKLSDYLTCMQPLPDNSLIMGGYSNSYKSNTKKGIFLGVTDFWVLKLLPTGTKQWDKTIGGAGGGDYLASVQQTKDKGFILGGYSNSNIGNSKTQNCKGGYDFWIVKIDSLGRVQWDKTIGGNGDDILTAVYEVDSNKYVVAGTSASELSGDKTSNAVGAGKTDFWVMTLGAPAVTTKTTIAANSGVSLVVTAPRGPKLEIMPNPVKEILTIRYSTASLASNTASFTVYAANGNTMLQSTLGASRGESMRSFNIATLPNGAYFAVLYIDGVKLTKAFTKE